MNATSEMKVKEWGNKCGAEVTYKRQRISIQNHGKNGFAVAVRRRPFESGENANLFYGVNPDASLGWEALALWGYEQWKNS